MRYDNYRAWRGWKQELTTGAIALGVMAGLGGLCVGSGTIYNAVKTHNRDQLSDVLWEEFTGTTSDYKVEISDSERKDGHRKRIMHLEALNENTQPQRITGHDYNQDGNFDRLFIMSQKLGSCNSVYFTPNGRVWEPCPADAEKKGIEFTDAQVIDAQRKLYDALATVRTEEHKTRHWTPGCKDL